MQNRGLRVTVVGSGDATATGGRRQTCFHLQTPHGTLLMDCGPASLVGLRQLDLALDTLQGVLLTHDHGDHCAGIPFLLFALFETKRQKPFYLLGPAHMNTHLQALTELCYPGLWGKLGFSLSFIALESTPTELPGLGWCVSPYPVQHQIGRLCLGYQVQVPTGQRVAYSGDTMWNDNLPRLAAATDVFFCECSLWEPQTNLCHLSYQELQTHRHELQTKQLVFTHLSSDAWQRHTQITETVAYDGMVIAL